ncbi:molybdate ABC transporter permease subunit [Acidocella sp. KAb 2-4]|uniref:molybdate ABC transporter permease subunit n=1 Tax=Acidocella sp. KAb 2-4 TaxID=2885158 RepID=UPI001D066994|nr:molybdate ABC transporter permease subunit [Acidocella sp. KAb 2-4]MCB5944025.1 molybdate ABC transporter permease subunit [Acidocella sp. KAb 2-4]
MPAAIPLTLELAGLSTALLLLLGVPLAWGLARGRGWWVEALGAVIALPLVLPPTVLGFYLLILLGPHGPLAPLLALAGLHTLAFSFTGLVIGSVVCSLPFMVQPVRSAFAAIGSAPWEAALTLRAAPWDAFVFVILPLARGGIVTGAILSFAHTLGEFGMVLMLGGDIPGKTEVLSIVIFNDVETLRWPEAGALAAGMAVFSFGVILVTLRAEARMARLRA